MPELLNSLFDIEVIKSFLSDASSNQFTHTLLIFTAAAFVHSKTVGREIRRQMRDLITVVRDDLKAQQILVGTIITRVTIIEEKLKGEK